MEKTLRRVGKGYVLGVTSAHHCASWKLNRRLAKTAKFLAVQAAKESYAYPADLHLKAGSMCIDTGTSAGAIPGMTDFFGVTRPVNGKYDIGACAHSDQGKTENSQRVV